MSERSAKRKISNDELITWVQQEAVKLGRVSTCNEFKHGRLAIVRYSSWNKFLDEAGLKAGSGKWERISNKELIEAVWETAAELGRTPSYEEYKNKGPVRSRYGTWAKFGWRSVFVRSTAILLKLNTVMSVIMVVF